MPASMISEATGSNSKVIGSSNATVAVGPMPGSTPTAVPSVTPSRQMRMLVGWSAVSRPRRMPSTSAPQPVAEQRQPQLQQPHEDDQAQRRDAGGRQRGLEHARAVAGERGDERRHEERRTEAEAG